MSIVVMGTVALDTIKTPHGFKKNMLGGSASHFAVSARLFTPVHLAAVIGEDFPEKHITFLKRKGVDLASLTTVKGTTFRWEGEYRCDDLNTACTLKTSLGVISSAIPRLDTHQRNIKHVFLANYDPDVQQEFLKLFKNPQLVGMDTMNLWINTKLSAVKRLLKKVDILIVNDTEAKDLTHELNLLKAARCLESYGPKMVIIKKGEHGGIFYSKRFIFAMPAYPLEIIIDPTGAGDTFAGAVMGYLVKSSHINASVLTRAISYAIILSSFNVEDFGLTKTAALTLKEVHQRMKIFRRFFLF